jgi:hypothetical protein
MLRLTMMTQEGEVVIGELTKTGCAAKWALVDTGLIYLPLLLLYSPSNHPPLPHQQRPSRGKPSPPLNTSPIALHIHTKGPLGSTPRLCQLAYHHLAFLSHRRCPTERLAKSVYWVEGEMRE